jgi:pimeloyl-ACP methyl ester carboxylesterase
MFEKIKARIVFQSLFKRPDIMKAYKMVGPEDSWYDTITTVHNSLAKIQQLPCEEWEITSHDDLTMKAVFYPGTSNKTMIWIHGYTSHAERESAFPALFYRSLGYNVLIPYLRAHGPSEGKYIAFGSLETMDLFGWVDRVNRLHPSGSIMLHGLSMGGGIVLNMADAYMKNVKCLLADAPNTSIESFFRDVSKHSFKRGYTEVFIRLLQRYRKEFGVEARDYNGAFHLGGGMYPLLLSAGSNENLDQLLQELKRVNPQPTRIVILPGCNHGNGMYKQTEMYQTAIREFMDEYMR